MANQPMEGAMSGIVCKKRQASDRTKSGVVRGHQRYRCKACGCHYFTSTPPRGKHPVMKALTVLLYGMGNMSLRISEDCWAYPLSAFTNGSKPRRANCLNQSCPPMSRW